MLELGWYSNEPGSANERKKCGFQLFNSSRSEQFVLQREIRVAHNRIQRLPSLRQHSARERAQHRQRVARNSHVLDRAFFIPYPPQLAHSAHDLLLADKLRIVAVHHIQILRLQALQTARDALPHPRGRVVELITRDAADFCEEEVLLSRNIGAHEGCVESCAEDLLGRTVVGRRVKGADAVFQGLLHEASCVKLVRVGVVLVVECGRSGRLLGFLTFTIFVVFSTTYPKIRGGRMLLSLGD